MLAKIAEFKGIALTAALLAVIVCTFAFGASRTSEAASRKQLDGLADAVRRAAVQCYAIEGFYPPDVSYLEDNYGLAVNKSKYFIAYSTYSSAVLPQIEVIALNG